MCCSVVFQSSRSMVFKWQHRWHNDGIRRAWQLRTRCFRSHRFFLLLRRLIFNKHPQIKKEMFRVRRAICWIPGQKIRCQSFLSKTESPIDCIFNRQNRCQNGSSQQRHSWNPGPKNEILILSFENLSLLLVLFSMDKRFQNGLAQSTVCGIPGWRMGLSLHPCTIQGVR